MRNVFIATVAKLSVCLFMNIEFLSINHMVTRGQKIWIIIDTNAQNVRTFLKAAAKDVVDAEIPGSPEEKKEPCPCFHLRKNFFFSPDWLTRHGILFNIIIQQQGDLVITDGDAFHQIINTEENVTVARNLCTDVRFISRYSI